MKKYRIMITALLSMIDVQNALIYILIVMTSQMSLFVLPQQLKQNNQQIGCRETDKQENQPRWHNQPMEYRETDKQENKTKWHNQPMEYRETHKQETKNALNQTLFTLANPLAQYCPPIPQQNAKTFVWKVADAIFLFGIAPSLRKRG